MYLTKGYITKEFETKEEIFNHIKQDLDQHKLSYKLVFKTIEKDIEIYVYNNPEDGNLHDDYVDVNGDCFGTKTDIKSILRNYKYLDTAGILYEGVSIIK